MSFSRKLKELGVKKVDLAEVLGLRVDTVYRWRDSPPRYVLAYLELFEKSRGLEAKLTEWETFRRIFR